MTGLIERTASLRTCATRGPLAEKVLSSLPPEPPQNESPVTETKNNGWYHYTYADGEQRTSHGSDPLRTSPAWLEWCRERERRAEEIVKYSRGCCWQHVLYCDWCILGLRMVSSEALADAKQILANFGFFTHRAGRRWEERHGLWRGIHEILALRIKEDPNWQPPPGAGSAEGIAAVS